MIRCGMRVVENQEFVSKHLVSGTIVEDIAFKRCYFDNCSARPATNPAIRTQFRRLQFKDCRVWACHLEDVILEDVTIDGLKTGSGSGKIYPFGLSGCMFTHVTLRGNVGGIGISDAWSWFDPRPLWGRILRRGLAPKDHDRLINGTNRAHYAAIDWALDISEARFSSSPTIRGIPARLIRLDPSTQAVVIRSKVCATESTWRALDIAPWDFWLDECLTGRRADDEIILVAARRSRSFKQDVVGLQRLREAGVAEPD